MGGQSDPVLGDGVRDRRAIVTGASSGVGLEIARRLAAAGAQLVLPVRDRERGAAATRRIHEAAPGAAVELRDLDLGRLASVRAFVGDTLAEDRRIDLLVLNAGIARIGDRARRVTEDGFELHFQTNFLAHAALVLGILPLLERSRARVIVQGSIVSAVRGVRWDDLQHERRYRVLDAYGSSKTALGLFAVELARRAEALTVALAHPGIVPDTAIAPDIRDRVRPALRDAALRRLGNRPGTAAEPALLAAVAELRVAQAPACFAPAGWLGLAGPGKASRAFRRIGDVEGAARVWALVPELLGDTAAAPGACQPRAPTGEAAYRDGTRGRRRRAGTEQQMRIGIILGSIRETRRTAAVADYVAGLAAERTGAAEYDLIDLGAFNLPLLTTSVHPMASKKQYADANVQRWSEAIDACDAFVFVTPEYNHGVPGGFKNAVDSLGAEWVGKPVAFAGHGTVSGVRAIEQWRQIIINFSMPTTRAELNFNGFTHWPDDVFAPEERHEGEVHAMLDELEELVSRLGRPER